MMNRPAGVLAPAVEGRRGRLSLSDLDRLARIQGKLDSLLGRDADLVPRMLRSV